MPTEKCTSSQEAKKQQSSITISPTDGNDVVIDYCGDIDAYIRAQKEQMRIEILAELLKEKTP